MLLLRTGWLFTFVVLFVVLTAVSLLVLVPIRDGVRNWFVDQIIQLWLVMSTQVAYLCIISLWVANLIIELRNVLKIYQRFALDWSCDVPGIPDVEANRCGMTMSSYTRPFDQLWPFLSFLAHLVNKLLYCIEMCQTMIIFIKYSVVLAMAIGRQQAYVCCFISLTCSVAPLSVFHKLKNVLHNLCCFSNRRLTTNKFKQVRFSYLLMKHNIYIRFPGNICQAHQFANLSKWL
jgi:hypothetical protein